LNRLSTLFCQAIVEPAYLEPTFPSYAIFMGLRLNEAIVLEDNDVRGNVIRVRAIIVGAISEIPAENLPKKNIRFKRRVLPVVSPPKASRVNNTMLRLNMVHPSFIFFLLMSVDEENLSRICLTDSSTFCNSTSRSLVLE